MTGKQILIVEDEKPIRDMIAFGLRRAGFDVREAEDCAAARASIADARPDLLLIDWMLPDQSGLELTRAVKRGKDTQDLPVIMLTARADEHDKVSGLEVAPTITSPSRSARASCWRASTPCCGEARRGRRRIARGGRPGPRCGEPPRDGRRSERRLGPTEYRLLQFFMEHPERVYSRGQLLDRVWGGNVYVEERTVDVHIRRLRKALEPSGRDGLVQTVRGSGYRFSTRPE
jgi:two-component system phosphate regulon response regulator PhoB